MSMNQNNKRKNKNMTTICDFGLGWVEKGNWVFKPPQRVVKGKNQTIGEQLPSNNKQSTESHPI